MDERGKWETTPMMITQVKWHYDFAMILRAAESEISMKELGLATMLFRAVELNNPGTVQHLVDNGVSILSRDERFKTA